ncbi:MULTISPECIES: hypothetical protein [Acinetobacter calcoaceticus/baumannii complex]|nr:hypothetical protein [Acinetobacter baumannii]AVN06662.1 hypothetical protein C7R87_2130 [Acinetobacter baumannii]ETR56401.1 hypothetical protein V427_0552 [Acinetobacter baumannii UH10707]ETR58946.1 hypothetical protein V427_0759 [Acinetobacter baumannii UH10707]EXE00267.1 hypothetical protein J553_3925 [Acinetobacter baumannii 1291820]EXE18236.1 hypothetical protein J562_4378 [Acinetobacter baumannii 1440750]
MFEQILKRRPKGATHWQAGYYYNSDECGIWSIWENGKWHGDFKFPDGVMTKLPEEKEPVMSEFEGKSGKWAWEIQKEQQAKVEELQKRLDGALKETQYALQYVEEDMRGNHEFLQMAMIRTLKAIEQVLKGGA